jgi:hypothetical protein
MLLSSVYSILVFFINLCNCSCVHCIIFALYHFVSFIACVVLCAVFCLSVVCYLRDVCHLCIVSYCSTTATGLKTHLQF